MRLTISRPRMLRMAAVICAVLATADFCVALFLNDFPHHEQLVIKRKYVSGVAFRIDSESLKPGLAYDTPVSRGFYEATHTGDYLRSPFQGCLRLIRDGRTIRLYFSDDAVSEVAYALAALVPLVVFVKPKTFHFRGVVWSAVAILEGVIIGMTIFELFLPC